MTTHTRKITVAEFRAMPDDPAHRREPADGEPVDWRETPTHGIAPAPVAGIFDPLDKPEAPAAGHPGSERQ